MNHLILALSTLLLFSQSTSAQTTERIQLSEKTKTALQDYQNKEVYPVKKSIHDQLWASLSETDRTFVETKRAEYEGLRQEAREVRMQLRRDRKAGQVTDRAAAMAPIREQQKALLEALRPVLDANKAALDRAMEDLKSHHMEWKTARKAILQQYESEERLDQWQQRLTQRKERRAKKGQLGTAEQRRERRAVRFLLWDGQPHSGKNGRDH